MKNTYTSSLNKDLDLVLERHIEAPKELIWRALVEPELVKKWFCPKPWQTVDCRIDLRVGGEFYTVMQSPEGQNFPNTGCFLDISKNERIIWTSALQSGFRPAAPVSETDKACAAIIFTCMITLEEKNGGTIYKAHVIHGSPQQMKMHEEMGFHDGWGICLMQMIDMLKSLKP
jgi:uncharacterized protein YndB with AHSA1/START domain